MPGRTLPDKESLRPKQKKTTTTTTTAPRPKKYKGGKRFESDYPLSVDVCCLMEYPAKSAVTNGYTRVRRRCVGRPLDGAKLKFGLIALGKWSGSR